MKVRIEKKMVKNYTHPSFFHVRPNNDFSTLLYAENKKNILYEKEKKMVH